MVSTRKSIGRHFAALSVVVATAGIDTVAAQTQLPGAARQQELLHLLHQDCGSCHGMSLQGGLGPALTATALEHKSADYLATTILQGRADQAMPPWRDILSEAEVDWLVHYLKTGNSDDE
jgi:cytochrome c55X